MAERRRRVARADRYKPPPAQDPAPVDRVVDEGVLIAEVGARLAVKNAIIVGALRDGSDFDPDALADLAAERLEEHSTAERKSVKRAAALRQGQWAWGNASGPQRAEIVRTALAERLHEMASDRAALDAIVERAKADALTDIGESFVGRARALVAKPEGSAEERDERVAAFLALDLTELAAERGVELV